MYAPILSSSEFCWILTQISSKTHNLKSYNQNVDTDNRNGLVQV